MPLRESLGTGSLLALSQIARFWQCQPLTSHGCHMHLTCRLSLRTRNGRFKATARLDEPIGLIHASMEFIFEPKHSSIPFLVLVPFGSSLCTLLVVAILLSCFMLVLTAGPVDSKGIQIDGNHYPSMYKCLGRAPKRLCRHPILLRGVQKPWNGLGWDLAMVLFVAGTIWVLELMPLRLKNDLIRLYSSSGSVSGSMS